MKRGTYLRSTKWETYKIDISKKVNILSLSQTLDMGSVLLTMKFINYGWKVHSNITNSLTKNHKKEQISFIINHINLPFFH